MTDRELEEIRVAARRIAIESARAQGLPDTITDPETVARIAILLRNDEPAAVRRAA